MQATTMARAAGLALALFAGISGANAQSIAAYVNGEPITTYDIEQRGKINRLARQPTSRGGVLNELIDDKVKLAEARRIGYRIQDTHVDEQIQRIAKQNNQTMLEFNQTLNKVGVDMNAYRQKLMANYAWELAMERRNKPSATIGDPLFHSAGSGANVTDYTLYSVIFVVPRGAAPGAKMALANAARARFRDCASGLEVLRKQQDVAVRSPIRRSSDSLPAPMNKILQATPVNRLTTPFPSEQGIETIAVCEKTQRYDRSARSTSDDDAKTKNAAADAYLKSLRAKAVIQYRR